jgi:hypothetical protein
MRTIQTTAGTAIELDGDVLAVLEAISLDLKRSKGLDYDYEDVEHEFQHIVAQLTDDELRTYLKESLVMSFNRYENERLRAMIRRANEATDEGSGNS